MRDPRPYAEPICAFEIKQNGSRFELPLLSMAGVKEPKERAHLHLSDLGHAWAARFEIMGSRSMPRP